MKKKSKMITEAAFLNYLRSKTKDGLQRRLAERAGISDAYMSDILLGRRNIPEAVANIFKAKRHVMYEVPMKMDIEDLPM